VRTKKLLMLMYISNWLHNYIKTNTAQALTVLAYWVSDNFLSILTNFSRSIRLKKGKDLDSLEICTTFYVPNFTNSTMWLYSCGL